MNKLSKPSKKEIVKFYNNFLQHLKGDLARANPRHAAVEKELKTFISPGDFVLDMGCGIGITTSYIATLGAEVIGVDLAPALISYAERFSVHDNASYQVGDITELSLGKTFDVICLIDVLEHIPREAVVKVMKVLESHSNPNTTIILNVPDARFMLYMRKHFPDRLQIIDESYSMILLIPMFQSINFELMRFYMYGLDCPSQYTTYVFEHRSKLEKAYRLHIGGK